MNERIRQLVRQAGLDDADFPIEDWDNIPLGKFAQLIAYECIDLALGSSHREDDMGAIVANKIKHHFGVKP